MPFVSAFLNGCGARSAACDYAWQRVIRIAPSRFTDVTVVERMQASSGHAMKPFARAVRFLALAEIVLLFSGCLSLLPAPVPLRQLPVRSAQAAPAVPRTLVILLPGRGGTAEDYAKNDFAAPLARLAPNVEAVAVDASWGYYARRTLVDRLHDDVIAPARTRGVQRIWLVGISMGGLGALLYGAYGPGDVDGMLLLSPFLGDDAVLEEIEKAGGLDLWQAKMPRDPDDYQRNVWRWLKEELARDPSRMAICLGYPTEDSFARGQRLLAERLPPARVWTTPGTHTWGPWKDLWERFLESGALAD